MSAVVLGGGLAGRMAAHALADRGVAVTLVDGGPGATALCGGSLDVAAASPGISWLPWRDPLRGRPLTPRERLRLLLAEAPAHPYSVLWGDDEKAAGHELEAAIADLRTRLAASGLGLHGSLDVSQVVPNLPGTVRVADHVLTGPAGADVGDSQEMVWVDVPGLEAWDPAFAARTLAHELEALGLDVPTLRVLRRDWPEMLREPRVARLAARLDAPAEQDALAAFLQGQGAPGRVLLLPPILGLEKSADLIERLSEAAGGPVAEVLGHAPHATAGFRLQRALEAAGGGLAIRRARVSAVHRGPDGVQVALADGTRIDAEVLLLATGRFVARGLDAAGNIREPLLGLPLFDADHRRIDGIPAHRSVRKGYGNPQPLYSAGVRVDGSMRPLAARGDLVDPRVFCAGDIVGGFDPARERTGLGVALATARRAASAIAEQLQAGEGAAA